MSKYSIFRRQRPGALLLDFRTFRVRLISLGFDPIFVEREPENANFEDRSRRISERDRKKLYLHR